nr:ATP-binding protein [Paenibacillus sp. SZ31]
MSKYEGCKKELSKDVSAFANSDGGILVYGVVEEGNIPVRIDNGCDPVKVTREWIEQVIDSRIQRKIDGIRIHQVDLSGENFGRVLYVISIPQSVDAPHMADDNRYYKRYNFKSSPMEDYEVRDVRRRHDHPNLKLQCFIYSVELGSIEKELKIDIYNTSSIPAEYYGVRLYIDKRILILDHGGFMLGADAELLDEEGKTHLVYCLLKPVSNTTSIPIWEGETFGLEKVKLMAPTSNEDKYFVGWHVSGPGFMNFDAQTFTF